MIRPRERGRLPCPATDQQTTAPARVPSVTEVTPCPCHPPGDTPPAITSVPTPEPAVPAYPSTPHAQPLADLGFDPGWAAAADRALADLPAGAADRTRVGRVVRADRGRALVQTAGGLVHARSTADAITGDWVLAGAEAGAEAGIDAGVGAVT